MKMPCEVTVIFTEDFDTVTVSDGHVPYTIGKDRVPVEDLPVKSGFAFEISVTLYDGTTQIFIESTKKKMGSGKIVEDIAVYQIPAESAPNGEIKYPKPAAIAGARLDDLDAAIVRLEQRLGGGGR
jgi:hypothetical protein